MNFNLIFLFATFIISSFADHLEPPSEVSSTSSSSDSLDKPKPFERKAAKGLDEESTSDELEKSDDEDEDDNEKFIKIMANDLNFPSGGIKIVKAPDLSKDNEGKKITEALAQMLENQEKWIQKIEEELEEINKNDADIPVERERTAEEIEGNF